MSNTQAKPLLVFAHKGEAGFFLDSGKPVLISGYSGNLWRLDNYYLLVTGEGLTEALFATTRVLSKFSSEINFVVNIGVAGALNPSIEEMSVVEPRLVLGQKSDSELEYKSFETHSPLSKYYLVSALLRVKSEEERMRLSHYAELVDREGWSVAYVAKKFKVPFSSIKIVSDMAGPDTQCFDVKQRASEFSKKLYNYYMQNFVTREQVRVFLRASSQINLEDTNKLSDSLLETLEKHNFHFTKNQAQQLLRSKKLLGIKDPAALEHNLNSKNLKSIKSEYKRPKDRTRALLSDLQASLNPFHNQVYTKLNSWFSTRPACVTSLETDPSWEQDFIKLGIKVDKASDRKDLISFIESLPIEEYKKIFEGEF